MGHIVPVGAVRAAAGASAALARPLLYGVPGRPNKMSAKKFTVGAAVILLMTLACPSVLAQTEPAAGSPSTTTTHFLEGKLHTAAVTVDSNHRQVTARVKPATSERPSWCSSRSGTRKAGP